jgi:2-polyprenyl-3-methyl-5-hydroxy-6-metoxy-1,4-benzoquinol methylase
MNDEQGREAHPTDRKRTEALSPTEVQRGNKSWWTDNPMSYDWRGELKVEPLSREWFDAIDDRFVQGSRLFATTRTPFDRIMPFERLKGARVLEIGCGMGLHTELMARAGADVTAVDLTPTAVRATTRRLELKGLRGRVQEADAEALPFPAESFDFVWSWGVIHHSARTARIVREIARVLAPSGECRVMVYNRDGAAARAVLLRDYVLRGGFLRRSVDEQLYAGTDGFSARYYVREQFEDLFRAFFDDVSTQVLAQEADVLPLPRALRRMVRPLVSDAYMQRAQSKMGGFLFLTANGRRP